MYTTKTTVNYPVIEIEVFKNGKYSTSTKIHIGQYKRYTLNASYIEFLKVDKKWGTPECLEEISKSVEPYLSRWYDES